MFAEAVLTGIITVSVVLKALVKFLDIFGLLTVVQKDQPLTLSAQVINQLSISQHYCSAYHPESQHTLRRFDQTLKHVPRIQF